jgi:hypothetical protein
MTMPGFCVVRAVLPERRTGAGTPVTAAAFGWPPGGQHQNPGLPDSRCNRRCFRHKNSASCAGKNMHSIDVAYAQ